MTLTKSNLKQAILQILKEEEDPRLKGSTMTSGQFTTGGKEQRKGVDSEVDNNERALIHQIDQFLLNLAALPGVQLQQHRMTLQTILKTLQKKIGSNTPQVDQEQGAEL